MFEIERVLQSHEEFVLGDDLHINLIHVKMPSGSGNANRKRNGVICKRDWYANAALRPLKTKTNCVPHGPSSRA